jgi:hypothetical protein
MTRDKTSEQLVREEVERQALERAAVTVEGLSGSTAYEQAWRKAARAIRELKP